MKEDTKREKRENQKAAVAMIRADRLLSQQEMGWLFRPLAICPFPAKPFKGEGPEETPLLWSRKAGNVSVEIIGHPKYGVPYGQDILIVLYLAVEAQRQKSRKITVNFYRDFMRMFDMNPNDGRKYGLVKQSMTRIRNALFKWEVEQGEHREKGATYVYIEEWDLYFDPKNPTQRPLLDQYILLSERFWHEISTHKIPFNLEAVKHLKAKISHLNFYIWLSYRVWRAWQEKEKQGLPSGEAFIPFWGEYGLQGQMSSVIEKKFEFRREVRKWLDSVKELWPKCPVDINGDGLKIQVAGKDQLDIMPEDTDSPRIFPNVESQSITAFARTDICPKCGKPRTLQPGKINQQKNFRYPDWWSCSGKCSAEALDANCPDCDTPMKVINKGRQDYHYQCPNCGRIEGGEAYWLKYSVFVQR